MNVIVDIDRIVLDGVDLPATQHAAFRAAVRRELTRLVHEGGIPSHATTHVPRAAGATAVALGAQPRGATLGRDVARSVYGGLAR